MARRNDSWGIEVGANAIKAMRLARVGKGVELLEYEVLPFKQVLTTPEVNVEEAVQVNLDAFLAKHDLSKSNVVVSVPGHLAFARFAKLPPVEPKKIPDIVRFEAQQQIPFPIDQVEWDYQVFQQADSPDVQVGIFAITKERVAQFLSNYRQVNMRIDALTLSPLAVYNAFAYEAAGEGGSGQTGTIYMDIGTASTDVIIVEDGGIWLRTLPIGGNNFTDALVKSFKLSFAKAEKLKKEAGTSKYARQIFQAMRPVFADLVQELQRSLGYYQSMNRDAELTRLVGVGSTFRLPGLQKFLKQQLQMEVIRPDGFSRLHVEGKQQADFADNALNMATAYGLALQGLGLETVNANVLPQSILKARLWKAKQPWIAAAAASIAIASGLAGVRWYMDERAFNAAFDASQPRITPIVNRAQGYASEWDTIQGVDPRLRIENLRRIVDYRDLWPKLMEDLAAASMNLGPQPALLQPNYAEMQRVPANERKRLYIDTFKAEYLVGPDPGPAAPPVDPATMLTGQFETATFWVDGQKPPRFQITITGTSPNRNAVNLVSQQFIGWLKSHQKQANRPYTIEVDDKPILSTSPVRRLATDNPGGNPGAFGGQFGGGPNFGGGGPNFGGPGGMFPGAPGGQAMQDWSLLPLRPVQDEKLTGATRFEIRFNVHLLKPDEARRAEEADQARRPAPAATPASTPEPAPAPAEAPTTPAAQTPTPRDAAQTLAAAADQEVRP